METWRFKAKAVTKYNPKYRNSEGVYTLDEWTSRSDIGKKIDSVTDAVLTKERYLEVEDNYIHAVKIFMREVGAVKVRVFELYKHSDKDDFERWNDNSLYGFFSGLKKRNMIFLNLILL